MRRLHLYLRLSVLVAGLATAACGGSSSPAAPAAPTNNTSASTAPVIAAISPSSPTASTTAQTLTITGTNFATGMSLVIIAPNGGIATSTSAQMQSLTSTSFQVSAILGTAGTFTFKVTSAAGEQSNALAVAVQLPPAVWITEGVRLNNADVGFTGALADSTTIRLLDGRWRMYYFTGQAYRSAVSSDGLAFTVESGIRIPNAGQARVIRLDDGRIRAFYSTFSGILSSVSSDDGVTFVAESGARLAGSYGGPSLVRRNGVWRMYVADRSTVGSTSPVRVWSATSTDTVNWTLDAGFRLGAGATLTGSADHPGAVINSDGSTSLYYFRSTAGQLGVQGGIYLSTSADGLSFTTETSLRLLGLGDGADSDVIVLPDGSQRMYYNWGDDNFGVIYSARKAAGSSFFVGRTPK